MSILIFLIVSYILLSISLYLIFPKMGIDKVKGLIPGVNFIEWMKAVGRPGWHAAYLLIPIVQFFVFVNMCIQLVRSFKKYKLKHSAAAMLYAPAAFTKLAFDDKAAYDGPSVTIEKEYADQLIAAKEGGNERQYKKLVQNNPFKKAQGREWIESIVFAVFAAAFIRMFLIEAYVIPTPSMEGSLNVGDYLFVSKAHYGIRTPMTVAMIPLLHNRIPGMDSESYLKKPSLPYKRLPALESIDNNEPFVFNWPVGDSVYVTSKRPYTVAQVERNPSAFLNSDPELVKKRNKKEIITRPVDKKDHYIKRCIAIPGDSLQIIDAQVYINGKATKNPKHLQFMYTVVFPQEQINLKKLPEWGIEDSDIGQRNGNYIMFLDQKQVEQVKSLSPNITVTRSKNEKDPTRLFPHNPRLFPDWSVDDFGPIWMPKAGTSIALTPKNIALYRICIEKYEGNKLTTTGGQVKINGENASEYTFMLDYYWAMGDNRHNSEDSRSWGFVPSDHIVGKPLFIWFSKDESGINWDRIMKSANKD